MPKNHGPPTSGPGPTSLAAGQLQADTAAALAVARGFSLFRCASKATKPGPGQGGRDGPTVEQLAVVDP
jgi:hypothetical protein